MIVEWDEAKNRANAQKHGFQVTAAEEMFRHPLLVRPMREDYSENRWIGIGMIQGRVAFVVFAEDPNDTIRIISLRRANLEERKEYEEAIANGPEEN